MKNIQIIFLFFLAVFVMTFSSCKKEEQHDNTINISILEPTEDEIIIDCALVHIHVEVTASEENHEVEIVLHPEGDTSDKIIDFDKHDHDKVITFEQDVDLCSYGSGACFHLEVEACKDHDCEEKEFADVEFCLL